MNEHYPFALIPLPYSYDALEPHIDTKTMQLHHGAHLKGYVDTLNDALKDYPEYHNWSLERLINNSGALPESIRTTVRTRAGAVLNHNQYFNEMAGTTSENPVGEFQEGLINQFGSIENFKNIFLENAKDLFGSGWTFLAMDIRPESFGRFQILNLLNQDRPSNVNWKVILLTDVWEHAYYLKYNNRRNEYLDEWWKVVDWDKINNNYLDALSQREG